MSTIYDKIEIAIKEIKKIQDLMRQGLARPSEKEDAFRIAKDAVGLFTDEILKRKAEKISKITIWTNQSRDNFVAVEAATQLDPWVQLLEECMNKRKIKKELSSEKIHIESVIDGEDQHIYITEKGSGEHAHLIVDHRGTRELIRVDQKDQPLSDFIKSVEAVLKLKTGESVQITKNTLSFIEPESSQADVRAYTTTKDSYFVLEIYNNGDEDLEDFYIQVNWLQPEGPKERILKEFNNETDYLVMAHPKSLSMLKRGERTYSHIPAISMDKKIKVIISCKGMNSGDPVKKEFNLETQNQYK